MSEAAERWCPQCGASNRPIARRCDQCGAELDSGEPRTLTAGLRAADLQRPGVVAARLLNQAYSVSYRLIEHRLRGAGVSPAQFRALSLVKLVPPPATPGLLALHLTLDARTASDLIGRLEAAGWLRRERDLPDRRAVRLELTPEGEAVLARVWSPMVAAMEEAWHDISAEDVDVVVHTLGRVRDACLERLGYAPSDIFALGPQLTRTD
jgi:MarR family transcriptional regulator, multiple antibiotic resistance protein MarR